jgi:predicted DNA-binding ribbon-helix-helix protein
MGRPAKHSLTIAGHATSVSLEPEFWRAFRDIAARRGLALNALAAEIDADRGDTGSTGLATAIRLAVLADLTDRLAACQARRGDAAGTGGS